MGYNERMLKANQSLLDAYSKLNKNSDHYTAELQAIAKLHEQIANDEKNRLNYEATLAEIKASIEKVEKESELKAEELELEKAESERKSKELELEKAKLEAQIEADADKIALAEEQLEEEKKANRRGAILDVIGKVITIGVAVASGVVQWKMFERATRKEEDEVIGTQTDREVLKRGLNFHLRKD